MLRVTTCSLAPRCSSTLELREHDGQTGIPCLDNAVFMRDKQASSWGFGHATFTESCRNQSKWVAVSSTMLSQQKQLFTGMIQTLFPTTNSSQTCHLTFYD